jgi:superfamily II DNA or RNA helicase
MPADRLSWASFADSVVDALASAIGYVPKHHGISARWFLENSVKCPNDEFVRVTLDTLRSVWLPSYAGLGAMVDALREQGIGPGTASPTKAKQVEYLKQTRNCASLRRLIVEALIRYGDQDPDAAHDGEVIEGTRRFAVLVPSKQGADGRAGHPHQVEAWERLNAAYASSTASGDFRGLLVMPTGAGKTFTAVHWLLEKHINRGGRVLWLAHRHELLDQAAQTFHRLASLASKRETLRVRVVSGVHCSPSQIDPADDVLLCSTASLARRQDIVELLFADKSRMLVVDEAHHAPARTYRTIIEAIDRQPKRRLLGLTATPTRTAERERAVLATLFGRTVFHEVRVRDLIERGYLARPVPVRVQTRAKVEEGVTDEDVRHLREKNELSEDWLARIAHMDARNQVIVKHLCDKANRKKYGPTLIFAINVAHAVLLTEALRAANVEAEYVANYRPDGTTVSNAEVIDRFRSGAIEVLVNVQILTEGVDLPKVQTVFLTRPTTSEILLRQMIGRALRGPAVGGTEIAFLVSFDDHWERFRDWQGQIDLVFAEIAPDERESAEQEPEEPKPEVVLDALPWDLIRSTAAQLRQLGPEWMADAFEAVPNGWYVLERVVDGEEVRQVIPVHEHQQPCWDALIAHLTQQPAKTLRTSSGAHEFDSFFHDCDVPKPPLQLVQEMVAHFAMGGERPEHHSFEQRKHCDPVVVAREIHDKDMGIRARDALVRERYTELAKAIYPRERDFSAAIDDALREILHPDESTQRIRGVPVFEPLATQPLRPGPHHDLEKLWKETLAMARKLPGVPKVLPHEGKVEWSHRPMRNVFAMAHWDPGASPGAGFINVNRVLDSPDVSAAAVRYLLWHEYVHLFLQQAHTKVFREWERKWPGYIEGDRELDTLCERFFVTSW